MRIARARLKEWLHVGLIGLVAGLLLSSALGYYYSGELFHSEQRLKQRVAELEADLTQARLHTHTLETQLSLDNATQEALEQSLKNKHLEISALQEQLAFYEHLLPLQDKGAVNIRALDFSVENADRLHYKVLLQRPAGLPTFKGHIQFTAHGQQEGKAVTLALDTAGVETQSAQESHLAVEFDQFLRQTGLLSLPADLKIDTITLDIYQGKRLRATRSVDVNF